MPVVVAGEAQLGIALDAKGNVIVFGASTFRNRRAIADKDLQASQPRLLSGQTEEVGRARGELDAKPITILRGLQSAVCRAVDIDLSDGGRQIEQTVCVVIGAGPANTNSICSCVTVVNMTPPRYSMYLSYPGCR